MPLTRTASINALVLLHKFEQGPNGGFSPVPYRDSAGILTIGWGHRIQPSEHFDQPLTAAQADQLLHQDLKAAEAAVNKLVSVPITQSIFDALACFVFNVGAANFSGSTLLFELNQRRYAVAANELLRWDKAYNPKTRKKESLAGLVRRREAERQLYLAEGFS